MHLLVGLGNPGETYRNTRHNLGWDALTSLLKEHGCSVSTRRFKGEFGDGRMGQHRIFWLMPHTYMNLSGEAVGPAARFYKIEPGRVVVLHDDMDLALGRVRIKLGGGNAGHNGLKSIQGWLGTPDFVRIRLGIGRPPGSMDPARFVLQPFTADERREVETMLAGLSKAMPTVLEGNLPEAMNRFTVATQPPREVKPLPQSNGTP